MTDMEFSFAVENWPQIPALEKKALAKRILGRAMKDLASQRELASFYPALGLLEAFLEERIVAPDWKTNAALWYFRRKKDEFGERPGLNDYLMAKWLITRNPQYLAELKIRAAREDQSGYTCRWMLSSVAQRIPELNDQLENLDLTLGEFPVG